MNMGVALVQPYFRPPGYLAVSGYQILEAMRGGEHQIATYIDILAVRFPHASQLVPDEGRSSVGDMEPQATDQALGLDPAHVDTIIGEVKVGAAEINRAASDLAVPRSALMRFGYRVHQETARIVDALMPDAPRSIERAIESASSRLGRCRQRRVSPGIAWCSYALCRPFLRGFLRSHCDVLH